MTTHALGQPNRVATGLKVDPPPNRYADVRAMHSATSSSDEVVQSLPMELSSLGEHADRCNRSRGSMFGLRCAADVIHGFVASRVITTLVVAGLLIGLSSLIL